MHRCLVSKVGKSAVLRPPDARMLSWRFEVSPYRSGGLNEATILSFVATGLGVGWVLGTARWRCPETVVVLRVVDLNMPLPLALGWRRDNTSPLLANFIGEVQRLPDVQAVNKC